MFFGGTFLALSVIAWEHFKYVKESESSTQLIIYDYFYLRH